MLGAMLINRIDAACKTRLLERYDDVKLAEDEEILAEFFGSNVSRERAQALINPPEMNFGERRVQDNSADG